MNAENSDGLAVSQSPKAKPSNGEHRLELIKVILEFLSRCFYPAIVLLVIFLLYPAIGAIDLKGLVARLQSAKAGGYEFEFSEALKAEGNQTAELNGTIEQLKLRIGELTQDVSALKKAIPTATPTPDQIAKREAKEAQFSKNADYSILVFYKPHQREVATQLTKKLLSLGFKSSATPTDLKEAIKQFDEDTAWVVYSEKGKEKLGALKSVLPETTGRINFVYREEPYNLRSGDVQILLF
ncbi:MAG: hypothetical protein J0M20_12335 [Burkholderiales bacterium]|nr:hypothetical protein [Burkholderiales bacterium]